MYQFCLLTELSKTFWIVLFLREQRKNYSLKYQTKILDISTEVLLYWLYSASFAYRQEVWYFSGRLNKSSYHIVWTLTEIIWYFDFIKGK